MKTEKSRKADKFADGEEVFDNHPLPEKIGQNLRKIYDDVLNEPVPDDFLSLLAKADEKQK